MNNQSYLNFSNQHFVVWVEKSGIFKSEKSHGESAILTVFDFAGNKGKMEVTPSTIEILS